MPTPERTFLVGYGTLLNQGSLGHSIGRDAAGAKLIVPTIVNGYRRLFNLRPTHYDTSRKVSQAGIENAAMNVERAKGSSFNGLAFSVTPEELTALDQRERYYVRNKAPLIDFGTGAPLGEGHFYVGAEEFIEHDPARLMPLWRDIVWARAGAYRISQAFGLMFDETTFLADGQTLMVETYQGFLDDVSDVEMPG